MNNAYSSHCIVTCPQMGAPMTQAPPAPYSTSVNKNVVGPHLNLIQSARKP